MLYIAGDGKETQKGLDSYVWSSIRGYYRFYLRMA